MPIVRYFDAGSISSIERVDTVAYSTGYIHQEAIAFAPFSLPINYLTADTPAFLHIYFSTSKTLAENPGNTTPYLYAYPGTTLWIDDVYNSGGSVSLSEDQPDQKPLFHPNAACDRVHFSSIPGPGVQAVTLMDHQGRVVLSSTSVGSAPLYIGDLAPGLYLIHSTLSTGGNTIEKLIVE